MIHEPPFLNTSHDDSVNLQLRNNEYTRKHIPAMTFMGLIMITGIVGNVIVCHVYVRRFRQSPMKCLIITLAVLDILNCLITTPMKIYELIYYFSFGASILCWLSAMSATFFSLGASFIQFVIAIDRYLKICRPFNKQMTVLGAKISIGIVIFVSILPTIPAHFARGQKSITLDNVNGSICWIPDGETSKGHLVFTSILILLFIITLIILVGLYSCILKTIAQRKKIGRLGRKSHIRQNIRSEILQAMNPAASAAALVTCSSFIGRSTESMVEMERFSEVDKFSRTNQSKRLDKSIINITKAMFMVTFLGMVSFVPYFIVTSLMVLKEDFLQSLSYVEHMVVTTCFKSYFLHSAINPVIYSIFSSSFRRKLGQAFCKK